MMTTKRENPVEDAKAIQQSEQTAGIETKDEPVKTELPPGVEEGKDVLVTPEGQVLDLSIVGTMNIDPETLGGKVSKNANRLNSLKYGIAGMLYLLRREQSIQLASAISVVVIILGLWLQISSGSWAFLVLALGAIWITEALNTAIEASINIGASEPNAMAKIGKDVASAASLISSIVFVLVVVIVLLPQLLFRLREGF